MITAKFEIPEVNFQSNDFELPTLPRVGDQIFFTDFISEKEQSKILKINNKIDLEGLYVKHVAWFRNPKNSVVYFNVTLE